VIKISKRLKAVANYCPVGAIVVDVGSGHGKLPLYLCQAGVASQVIAVELNTDPLTNIRRLVQPYADQVEVRAGNGLQPVCAEEMEVVCIAGLSALIMTQILEAATAKLTMTTRLILQPTRHPQVVRQWLLDNGWELVEEQMVEEKSRRKPKTHTILVAEQGNPLNPYQTDRRLSVSDLIYLGPFLWRSRATLLRYRIESEIGRWQKALCRFTTTISSVEESDKRREQIEKHIGWLQSLLDQW